MADYWYLVCCLQTLQNPDSQKHRSGIGRELTLAALERGDKVIATGRQRSIHQLEDLKKAGADVLELDVTSPPSELAKCAERALAIHGRVDVLVNNAGQLDQTLYYLIPQI